MFCIFKIQQNFSMCEYFYYCEPMWTLSKVSQGELHINNYAGFFSLWRPGEAQQKNKTDSTSAQMLSSFYLSTCPSACLSIYL